MGSHKTTGYPRSALHAGNNGGPKADLFLSPTRVTPTTLLVTSTTKLFLAATRHSKKKKNSTSTSTCSAFVTIGQTSRRYFSRYLGNSVAKLLSSSNPDWFHATRQNKKRGVGWGGGRDERKTVVGFRRFFISEG